MEILLWHLLGLVVLLAIVFAGDGGGDAKGKPPTKQKGHRDYWL